MGKGGFTIANRSLRELCALAENADRSKHELQKLMEEENKSMELQFYKDMVARIMPKEHVDTMLANYRTRPRWANETLQYDQHLTAPLPTAPPKPAPLRDSTGNSAFLSRFQG